MPAVTQPSFLAVGNNITVNGWMDNNFFINIVYLNRTPILSLYTAITVRASIHFTIKDI